MLLGFAHELAEHRMQIWRLLAGEHVLHLAAMGRQQLLRQEQLPVRRVARQICNHLRDALGEPGMPCDMLGRLRRQRHDPRREGKQCRTGRVQITLQSRHGRHRIVVEIELMLVGEQRQRLDRQVEITDRTQ